MMDTAKQKVENLTKQADQLLVDPPDVTVMKEDVEISTPTKQLIAHLSQWNLAIDETVSNIDTPSLIRKNA